MSQLMFNCFVPGGIRKITIDDKDNVIFSKIEKRLWKANSDLTNMVQLKLKNVTNPKYHENYMYVFDTKNNSINRITLSDEDNSVLENKKIIGDLDYYIGVKPIYDFNSKGNIVLCYDNKMQEYDFNGILIKEIKEKFKFIQRELAIDRDDNIYISNRQYNNILSYNQFMEIYDNNKYKSLYNGLNIDKNNKLYAGRRYIIKIHDLNSHETKKINVGKLVCDIAFNSRNDIYIACRDEIKVFNNY